MMNDLGVIMVIMVLTSSDAYSSLCARWLLQGDAWQWVWFVPHDMKGLVSLFPSPEVYVERLERFFNQSEGWFLGNALPDPYYWAGTARGVHVVFYIPGNCCAVPAFDWEPS